ncbi:response regulator [Pleionea sediminis]|uniref:response regulator n=1 Tax=Pleionea sediminis TaxID=2569479 RepID=UPI0011863C42|nr:response regulator [Pleionea sediminis]
MSKPLSFMVVDDSSITIEKLSFIIHDLGHNVARTCSTGQEAVDEYGDVQPDVVTMDITMPQMNGIDATRSILQKYKDAKIIMVTSHGQEKMVMDAIEAGAVGYILKPFSREKLENVIKEASL